MNLYADSRNYDCISDSGGNFNSAWRRERRGKTS